MAGIRDILAKSLGSPTASTWPTPHRRPEGPERPDEIAALRGKPVDEVAPAAMLRAYASGAARPTSSGVN